MLSLVTPDADQVERWLRQAGIQHYICDQCHGLHISELQGREGVIDARLFVEEDGLLLSTELELQPSRLFDVQAMVPRLNMAFPGLKVFLDVNDETLPRLIACDLLLGRAGISFDQFIQFVQATVDATIELLDECLQVGCLFQGDDEPPAPNGALH